MVGFGFSASSIISLKRLRRLSDQVVVNAHWVMLRNLLKTLPPPSWESTSVELPTWLLVYWRYAWNSRTWARVALLVTIWGPTTPSGFEPAWVTSAAATLAFGVM